MIFMVTNSFCAGLFLLFHAIALSDVHRSKFSVQVSKSERASEAIERECISLKCLSSDFNIRDHGLAFEMGFFVYMCLCVRGRKYGFRQKLYNTKN